MTEKIWYPPTIPMNWVTFCVLFLVWGVASWVFLANREKSKEALAEYGLIGLLGALASMLLMTAFSFVPDDWSAVRLAVPLSWLYGYPIYSDINIHPGNAYFYMPFGLVSYLPAVFVGSILKSPNICLFLGWVTTIFLYITPYIIYINKLETNKKKTMTLFLFVVVASISIPSLRYVSTMAHVDAVGFFCIFLAIVFALPLNSCRKISNFHTFSFVVLIIASVFVKQTFWPISLIVFVLYILYYKHAFKITFALSVSLFLFLLAISIYVCGFASFLNFAILAPANAPSVLSVFNSFNEYFNINLPLIVCFIFILVIYRKEFIRDFLRDGMYFWIAFTIVFLVSSALSIYTFTKLGADSNHFAFPSALMLFACIRCFTLISKNVFTWKYIIGIAGTIVIFVFPVVSFVNTYCGWYLWVNSPHKTASKIIKNYPEKNFYFPWQPLSTMIEYNKMYHIDQSIYYEDVNKMNERSYDNIFKFLPKKPFYIPIRPYGADSFLVKKLNAKKVNEISIPELSAWNLYIVD
jgi:hypothetical protein